MNEQNSTEQKRSSQHVAPGSAWALNLGVVMGIPLRLHFTFFLLLAWIAFSGSGPNRGLGLLYVIGLFACVMLHELGHSVVAMRYGIRVIEIVLYPIGGVARMDKLPRPAQELWVALAGPAVNVVLAMVISLAITITHSWAPWENVAVFGGFWWQKLLMANIVLAVFNMIPAFPMDGGRVLRALLALKMNEVRATEIAAGIGQFLAIVFGFVGLMYNPFLLFIAFFIFLGAGQEAAMYRGKALVEGLPVSAAMITDFRVLPVGATFQQAADLLLQTSQQDFPVVHGDEVIGLLSRQALLRGLSQQGSDGYVAGSMNREFPRVTQQTSLQEVAEQLQSGEAGCILVMKDEQLLGMVTMENLAELLVMRRIMKKS